MNLSDPKQSLTISEQPSIYVVFTIFPLGLIGNLLNILSFTNLKIFRHNRFAFYLSAESFVNIIQISQFFLAQIWSLSINGTVPADISLVWCKMRMMMGQWNRMMLAFILCCAAIDQFLSTNPHRLSTTTSFTQTSTSSSLYYCSSMFSPYCTILSFSKHSFSIWLYCYQHYLNKLLFILFIILF